MPATKPAHTSAQVVLANRESRDDEVQSALRAAGFTTGPQFAGSFSISGAAELFERYFGICPMRDAGGPSSVVGECRPDLELPLTAMPLELRQRIEAVLFTKPPDFGPGNP
jgi:hypothetical protein